MLRYRDIIFHIPNGTAGFREKGIVSFVVLAQMVLQLWWVAEIELLRNIVLEWVLCIVLITGLPLLQLMQLMVSHIYSTIQINSTVTFLLLPK